MAEDNNNPNPDFSPEELRTLKTQYNKAKDILEKVSALQVKFEATQATLVPKQVEIEKISNDARERLGTIENAKNDSATFVAEIKSNLEKTQTSISQIDEGLRKFENIKGKIEGKDGEIEVLVQTANNLRTDIETAKTAATQRLAKIDELLGQVQEKITQIQTAYNNFVAVNAKITDQNTGLGAVLAQVQDLQKKATLVSTEIQSFRDQSQKYLSEIEGNKKKSEQLRDDIQKNLDIATEKRTEVEKIADLITDTGFANSFQSRAKLLRRNSYIWLAVFLLGIVGLAIFLYFVFDVKAILLHNRGEIPKWESLLYRLTLTSPLLFLIAFAIRRYGSERELEEKYSFKATVAEVMRNHADFLIQKIKEKGTDGDTITFIRRTIERLYSEPYEKAIDWKKIKKEKEKIELLNGIKKEGTEDFLSFTKELKGLVPDENLLKSISDLFLKIK
ncbi:MAG: hypothetical protein HYT39_02075 [Candidatus Sungbacteria bacterium]|nr:hypothetical protein [Candidatus Sungbacteria bacterium]